MLIINNDDMRDISVESDKKIYYAYLPLKTKAYMLKSKNIKEADYYDGQYHIDYSSIKTSKSTSIGIAVENKDYNVKGFKSEQGSRYVFVSSFEADDENAKSSVKMKKEKTEKKYQCLGSDFVSVIQIAELPSKYTSKTSSIKFNYNWEDGNRRGVKLLDILTKSYYGIKESYSSKGYKSKAARITNKVDPSNSDGDISFIWRKKGDIKWNSDYTLTFNKLLAYGMNGTALQMRFLENCRIDAYKIGIEDGQEFYDEDTVNSIDESFYGNILNVKIPKLKKKTSPKVKIDAVNMTIGIKNGMQVSFDQKNWYTIFPYSKNGRYVRTYFDEEINSYDEVENHATCRKINSISLLDSKFQAYLGKNIYVRLLGKNNLPSEIATVHLPNAMSDAPKLNVVNTNGTLVIQDITKGTNDTLSNVQYEYCIGEDIDYLNMKKSEFESEYYDTTIKWNKLKVGDKISNKLNSRYTYKFYIIGESDDGPIKIKTKSCSRTVHLSENNYGDLNNMDLYVRRKGDKSSTTLPSNSAHYRYDAENKTLTLIVDNK